MTEHVKVYGVKPRIQYIADGILTTYDFPFATFKASDIEVYLQDIKQATNTYTVLDAGSSDGGSVVFNSAPTSGTVITIIRNLSIERTSDFQEGSSLRAKVLNDELDYQIACTQQIAENLNRSMVLPPYATDNDLDLTLPTPSAGKAIVWNSDGTNLENSTVEVNALESTLKSYKIAAETAAGNAATQADNAASSASSASTQAGIATAQAETATTQAGIATTKATEVSNALSTKANTNMDNITSTGKKNIDACVMPSTSYVDYSYTKEHNYTAPANGYYYLRATGGSSGSWLCISLGSSASSGTNLTYKSDAGSTLTVIAPVSKNQVVTPSNSGNTVGTWRFYYAKGEI